MSDTPRTDAAKKIGHLQVFHTCEQLERELNEANRKLDAALETITYERAGHPLERELNEAKKTCEVAGMLERSNDALEKSRDQWREIARSYRETIENGLSWGSKDRVAKTHKAFDALEKEGKP